MRHILIIVCLLFSYGLLAQTTISFTYDDAGNRTAAASPGYNSCQQNVHLLTPIGVTTDMYYSDFIHIETQVLNAAQNVSFTAGNYVLADQTFEVPVGVEAILQTEVRECMCFDGIDNDGDNLLDQADPDCN